MKFIKCHAIFCVVIVIIVLDAASLHFPLLKILNNSCDNTFGDFAHSWVFTVTISVLQDNVIKEKKHSNQTIIQ